MLRTCCPPCCDASVGMTLLLLHFIELWAVAWSCECLPEVTLSLWRSSAPNPDLPTPGYYLSQLGPALPQTLFLDPQPLCHSIVKMRPRERVSPGPESHS